MVVEPRQCSRRAVHDAKRQDCAKRRESFPHMSVRGNDVRRTHTDMPPFFSHVTSMSTLSPPSHHVNVGHLLSP